MSVCTRSAVAMFREFFAADDIEATAHRTSFVTRASKITGIRFLALGTFGSWSEAETTLAQLATKITHLDKRVAGTPAAMHQHMNQKALVFLQAMIRQALAKVQSINIKHRRHAII